MELFLKCVHVSVCACVCAWVCVCVYMSQCVSRNTVGMRKKRPGLKSFHSLEICSRAFLQKSSEICDSDAMASSLLAMASFLQASMSFTKRCKATAAFVHSMQERKRCGLRPTWRHATEIPARPASRWRLPPPLLPGMLLPAIPAN